MGSILESHKLWNRLMIAAITIQLFLYTAKLLSWMSDNLKIPIIWHLEIVPIPEILLFSQKAPSLKQGHVQKILSVHQLLWYLLTSCLILCQILQLWRLQKTQRTLNHMKEIPKCSTLLLSVQPKYRYNKNLRQCSYHLFVIVQSHVRPLCNQSVYKFRLIPKHLQALSLQELSKHDALLQSKFLLIVPDKASWWLGISGNL